MNLSQRMSNLMKERWKNPEFRKEMEKMLSRKGRGKGRVLTISHRKNISETLKGHGFSNQALKKMSQAKLGRKLSNEHKEALREAARLSVKEGRHYIPWKGKTTIHIKKYRKTKPQLKLFEILHRGYPNEEIVLEYMIRTKKGWRIADIAFTEKKLDWEFDGPYHDSMEDQKRDQELAEVGWQVKHCDYSMLEIGIFEVIS
jgi:hypothetical protein